MLKAEYIKPAANHQDTGDFSDPRVILVRKGDPRACCFSDSECQIGQGLDTPTYMAIGAAASDEQLLRASERYGVPLVDLQEFRAQMVPSHG